jgi:hypothetical protein
MQIIMAICVFDIAHARITLMPLGNNPTKLIYCTVDREQTQF